MELIWRDEQYKFVPSTLTGGGDKWNRNTNVDCPVFGSDTESTITDDGHYEMQCFTISPPIQFGDDALKYVGTRSQGLWDYLHYIIEEYEPSLVQSGKAFIFFHNLAYDFGQLVKYIPHLLEMVRIGETLEKDFKIGKVNGYNIFIKKQGHFSGTAPNFELKCTKGTSKFTLMFRDSFSYFPSSLDRVSKDLGLQNKMERQTDLGLRDFRIEEDSEDKQYFEEYAKIDARNTRMIGEQVIALHEDSDMTKIRPSSPSFAIAKVLHGMTEEQSLVTGVDDAEIMQLIIDTYRGGRTGGIYHGLVENLYVYDFHSSYPSSMRVLPSFSKDMAYVRVDQLDLDNVMQLLDITGNAFLRISGTETDSKYPSLITTRNNKLTPIYGDFQNIATTGIEFYVGMKSGSLKNIVVHEMVILLDMEDDPFLPFRHFADTAYELKARSEKGTIPYVAAKLMLNSAYGKLIESNFSTLIGTSDERMKVLYLEGMEKQFGQYYFEKIMEAYENGKTFDDIYEDVMRELVDNFDEETVSKMDQDFLCNLPLSERVFGRYAIPAAASLITATSRARLLAAAKATGAIYWDTDSLFIRDIKPEEMNELLKVTDNWLPADAQRIRLGDELGDLDCEAEAASGMLAGTKRYYLEYEENGKPKKKIATHGLPAIDKEEQARIVLAQLATGSQSISYTSRPKPKQIKEADSPDEIGKFVPNTYAPNFQLDPRLDWIRGEDSWIGTIKPFENMPQKVYHWDNEIEILEGLINGQ